MKKKGEESITAYMNRFEKEANFAKKRKMDQPSKVKGLKLLHDAGLSDQDMKLMLTGINFEQETEVCKQAKKGLSKYMARREQSTDGPAIKLEGAFTTEKMDSLEESFLSRGWSKQGRGGRGGSMAQGDGRRGGFSNSSPGVKKPENPKDAQGNILKCASCESIRHLLEKCPDSYKNLKKFRNTILAATTTDEEVTNEESYITNYLNGLMMKEGQENRIYKQKIIML